MNTRDDLPRFESAKLTRCRVCGSPVVYLGPWALSSSKRLCSATCVAIDDVVTPGVWVDAAEALTGTRFESP